MDDGSGEVCSQRSVDMDDGCRKIQVTTKKIWSPCNFRSAIGAVFGAKKSKISVFKYLTRFLGLLFFLSIVEDAFSVVEYEYISGILLYEIISASM